MNKNIKELVIDLERIEKEYYILNSTYHILQFDKLTVMPKANNDYRDEQLSYLELKTHQLFTSKEFQKIIGELSKDYIFNQLSDLNKNKVLRYKKKIEKLINLPDDFVEEFAKLKANGYSSWIEARENNDYNLFKEDLKKLIEFSRKQANYINSDEHLYNVLLDEFEEGMTFDKLKIIFDKLKLELLDIYNKIKLTDKFKLDSVFKDKKFNTEKQFEVCEELYDMLIEDRNRFAWSKTVHPFMEKLGPNDFRVCTAVRDDPMFSFGSSTHECGHALHEMGFPKEYANSVLMDSASYGLHESQSRFWENQIFMSKVFWEGYFDNYKKYFPKELEGINFNDFYRSVNLIEGSLVRIEGDELTYVLHIIIRFEIEIDLIEGSLSVDNLPKIWNEKYKRYFGKEPSSLKEGVLQDVHWSDGSFGYFPTYAIGTIYASMFAEKLRNEFKDFDKLLEKRNFKPIISWFNQNVAKYTNTKLADEIVKNSVGKGLDINCYVNYLRKKYYDIYDINE